MPFKSEAQRRFAHAAAARGDFPKKALHEFDKASKGMSLPEYVHGKAHGGEVCPHCQGSGYANGGEIPADSDLGQKREADTGVAIDDPRYQLDVYRGENARAKAEAAKSERDAELAAAIRRKKARGAM